MIPPVEQPIAWFISREFHGLLIARCGLCGSESPAGDAVPVVLWTRAHVCAVVAYGRSLDAAANRATRAAG